MGRRGAWRIGGYVADELIGYGASAQVWRGHVGRTAEPIALKVLDLADGAAVRAAKAEAALLSALDHPHLVRLRELVPDGESIVLVLELAAGGSLARLLERRGRLSPGEVVSALSPIAAALAYAHDAGVVHSDVSPANVLFRDNGSSLLADLGVARLIGGFDAPRSTLAYVDPGVAAGGVPSEASDVFMVAATALHALTGLPPWPGDTIEAVLDHAVTGEIDGLDARLAGLPGPLADVMRRGLDPSPTVRGSAAEFALDLRHAAPPVPVDLGVGPTRPLPSRPAGPAAMNTDAASARAQLRSRLTSTARRSDDSAAGVYAPVPAPIAAATHGRRRREPKGSPTVGRLFARKAVPARSVAARSGEARSVAAGSVAAGSVAARSMPARSMPARSMPAGSMPARSVPAGSVPAGSVPARSVAASLMPGWVHVPRHALASARSTSASTPSGPPGAQSEVALDRPDFSRPDSLRPEVLRPEVLRPEVQRVDLARSDFARSDSRGTRDPRSHSAETDGGHAGPRPVGAATWPRGPAGRFLAAGPRAVGSVDPASRIPGPPSNNPPLELTHIVRSRVRPVEPSHERRWHLGRSSRSMNVLWAIVVVAVLAAATAAWLRWDPSWPRQRSAAAGHDQAARSVATAGAGSTPSAGGGTGASSSPTRRSASSPPGRPSLSPSGSAGGRSGSPPPATPSPRPGPATAPAAWPTTDAGWSAVLARLDLTRQRAFAADDPVPLSAVYTDVALLRQDRATLRQVVVPGCRLIGLRTTYRSVHALSAAAPQVVLSTQASLAPARLICPNRSPQAMAAHGPVAMTIMLARVRGQFLIASIQVPT